MNEFVAAEPWFSGWCGVMVNVSDVAAMGGRPLAVVDAMWAAGEDGAAPILSGLRDAAQRFGVPIVGGHTNARADREQLSVAILGRARALLTSFGGRPGDSLVAAIDTRGQYRPAFSNWDAATSASGERLRGDIALLPEIAESGAAHAAKDISQGGLVGTAAMLAEGSGVGLTIDLSAVPIPPGVPMERWLVTFPSYGYLIAARPGEVETICGRFARRGIAAARIGELEPGGAVRITDGASHATIWDVAAEPLIGCGPRRAAA